MIHFNYQFYADFGLMSFAMWVQQKFVDKNFLYHCVKNQRYREGTVLVCFIYDYDWEIDCCNMNMPTVYDATAHFSDIQLKYDIIDWQTTDFYAGYRLRL